MLKYCDNKFKFGQFRNRTTKPHRSNQKHTTKSFGKY